MIDIQKIDVCFVTLKWSSPSRHRAICLTSSKTLESDLYFEKKSYALHFLDIKFYQLLAFSIGPNNSLAVKRNDFDIIETFSNFLNAPVSSIDYYLPLTVNMAPIKNSLIPN